jgi:hypothetical protein
MTLSSDRPAFRALERAWLRRAITRVEPVLWIEFAALAALASAFLFWQSHIRLASYAHDRGVPAATLRLAAQFGVLALIGASQAGARHLVRLRASAGSPPWLALPLPEAELGRHLAELSRLQARWLYVPAAAFLVAALGVLPPASIALLAVSLVAVFELATTAACAIALAGSAARTPRRAGSGPLASVLAHAARAGAARRLAPATWGRAHAAVALWRNDSRLAWRVPATRRRAATAALAAVLSWAAWRAPIDPRAAHLLAFALGLVAAATVAEWLIATIGADPADVLRGLPIGVGAAWGARMGWALLAASTLVIGHALAARAVEPGPLRFFLVSLGASSVAIATLGINYGTSLYPRVEQAQRILALSLGVSMAASLMVPLMGWIVLLTAVLHSSRRVARWRRAEER